MSERFFPALLKHWRHRRGLSQLDLALHAEVSPRHVSFLETGRARPSAGMILRLLGLLDVPLHDQNEALVAAGFEERFGGAALGDDVRLGPAALEPAIEAALARMLERHEPYPMIVVSEDTKVLRANRGAMNLFAGFVASPARLAEGPDMLTMLFDPELMRPFVVEWEHVARGMLARLHREALHSRSSARIEALLTRVAKLPGVPAAWHEPELSSHVDPSFTLRLARDGVRVGFLITVTTFASPRLVTLDELRIESCFPLDAETERACERHAREP